jgi:hypothetical protein
VTYGGVVTTVVVEIGPVAWTVSEFADGERFVPQIHLQACRQYMIKPPPEDWTGVRHLTTK